MTRIGHSQVGNAANENVPKGNVPTGMAAEVSGVKSIIHTNAGPAAGVHLPLNAQGTSANSGHGATPARGNPLVMLLSLEQLRNAVFMHAPPRVASAETAACPYELEFARNWHDVQFQAMTTGFVARPAHTPMLRKLQANAGRCRDMIGFFANALTLTNEKKLELLANFTRTAQPLTKGLPGFSSSLRTSNIRMENLQSFCAKVDLAFECRQFTEEEVAAQFEVLTTGTLEIQPETKAKPASEPVRARRMPVPVVRKAPAPKPVIVLPKAEPLPASPQAPVFEPASAGTGRAKLSPEQVAEYKKNRMAKSIEKMQRFFATAYINGSETPELSFLKRYLLTGVEEVTKLFTHPTLAQEFLVGNTHTCISELQDIVDDSSLTDAEKLVKIETKMESSWRLTCTVPALPTIPNKDENPSVRMMRFCGWINLCREYYWLPPAELETALETLTFDPITVTPESEVPEEIVSASAGATEAFADIQARVIQMADSPPSEEEYIAFSQQLAALEERLLEEMTVHAFQENMEEFEVAGPIEVTQENFIAENLKNASPHVSGFALSGEKLPLKGHSSPPPTSAPVLEKEPSAEADAVPHGASTEPGLESESATGPAIPETPETPVVGEKLIAQDGVGGALEKPVASIPGSMQLGVSTPETASMWSGNAPMFGARLARIVASGASEKTNYIVEKQFDAIVLPRVPLQTSSSAPQVGEQSLSVGNTEVASKEASETVQVSLTQGTAFVRALMLFQGLTKKEALAMFHALPPAVREELEKLALVYGVAPRAERGKLATKLMDRFYSARDAVSLNEVSESIINVAEEKSLASTVATSAIESPALTNFLRNSKGLSRDEARKEIALLLPESVRELEEKAIAYRAALGEERVKLGMEIWTILDLAHAAALVSEAEKDVVIAPEQSQSPIVATVAFAAPASVPEKVLVPETEEVPEIQEAAIEFATTLEGFVAGTVANAAASAEQVSRVADADSESSDAESDSYTDTSESDDDSIRVDRHASESDSDSIYSKADSIGSDGGMSLYSESEFGRESDSDSDIDSDTASVSSSAQSLASAPIREIASEQTPVGGKGVLALVAALGEDNDNAAKAFGLLSPETQNELDALANAYHTAASQKPRDLKEVLGRFTLRIREEILAKRSLPHSAPASQNNNLDLDASAGRLGSAASTVSAASRASVAASAGQGSRVESSDDESRDSYIGTGASTSDPDDFDGYAGDTEEEFTSMSAQSNASARVGKIATERTPAGGKGMLDLLASSGADVDAVAPVFDLLPRREKKELNALAEACSAGHGNRRLLLGTLNRFIFYVRKMVQTWSLTHIKPASQNNGLDLDASAGRRGGTASAGSAATAASSDSGFGNGPASIEKNSAETELAPQNPTPKPGISVRRQNDLDDLKLLARIEMLADQFIGNIASVTGRNENSETFAGRRGSTASTTSTASATGSTTSTDQSVHEELIAQDDVAVDIVSYHAADTEMYATPVFIDETSEDEDEFVARTVASVAALAEHVLRVAHSYSESSVSESGSDTDTSDSESESDTESDSDSGTGLTSMSMVHKAAVSYSKGAVELTPGAALAGESAIDPAARPVPMKRTLLGDSKPIPKRRKSLEQAAPVRLESTMFEQVVAVQEPVATAVAPTRSPITPPQPLSRAASVSETSSAVESARKISEWVKIGHDQWVRANHERAGEAAAFAAKPAVDLTSNLRKHSREADMLQRQQQRLRQWRPDFNPSTLDQATLNPPAFSKKRPPAVAKPGVENSAQSTEVIQPKTVRRLIDFWESR